MYVVCCDTVGQIGVLRPWGEFSQIKKHKIRLFRKQEAVAEAVRQSMGVLAAFQPFYVRRVRRSERKQHKQALDGRMPFSNFTPALQSDVVIRVIHIRED
jgi:hypothetical protein